MALTDLQTFLANGIHSLQPFLHVVKGIGTNTLYVLEADPTTGQLPANTSGTTVAQVSADNVLHNAVNLASGAPADVAFDCSSFKYGVLHIEWSALNNAGFTVQVYTARNAGATYAPCPDLLWTNTSATAGADYLVIFPLVHEFIKVKITRNSSTTGTVTTSLTLKGPQ